MSVLILKNIPAEGPGTIADYLRGSGISYTVVDLQSTEFPDERGFEALIMMGGPMSVNEEDLYPYLTREMELARAFLGSGRKVLGVCLGAQLMAKALGARVYPGPEKEIGWYDIELVDAGPDDRRMRLLASDPATGRFSERTSVFQWHGETFDIPNGASRLARSGIYPNQAFRYGENAYAFQFHIEVTKQMIRDWLKDEPVDLAKLDKETEALFDAYHARANAFYKAFFN